jgi:hypothetical protein
MHDAWCTKEKEQTNLIKGDFSRPLQPVVQGRLLTHHSGGSHGDEEGLRRWFPYPAGCRKELLDPPNLASMVAAAYSRFRGKLIGYFRFSHRGEYIGGRAASGSRPGAHTMPWRGQGVACAMGWRGCLLAPLRLCFGLCHASGKIGTSAFVSSNFENISCVAFWKHKNNIKQRNGTLASR